jgi:uncharacterized protein YgbK (DUF1537 family)
VEAHDLAVAVIADDLSGAADCGVSFSRAGLDVAIQFDRRARPPGWAQTAVVPTDSRDQDAEEARLAVADAAASLAVRRPALWYKKIDSTLRGHLAAELSVMIGAARPELSVIAPAFPAHGRTVADGRGFLRGVPLERTEMWRAQGLRGPADLPAILRAGGLSAGTLGLADIRSGRVAERLAGAVGAVDIVVCDAETEEDLDAVAAGGLASGLNVLWAGSAGLAQHLARLCAPDGRVAGGGKPDDDPERDKDPGQDAGPLNLPPGKRGPVAVVAGSAAGTAAAQLRHLETRPGIHVVRVPPAAALSGAADELAAADQAIAGALGRGQDVAVGFASADAPSETVLDATASRAMSRALGRLVGRHSGEIGGFVLTGGDTALAVLEACGVTTLRPVGEVVTGVPVSVSYPDGRLAVTKAGAFGDDRTLARAVGLLHRAHVNSERNSSHVGF